MKTEYRVIFTATFDTASERDKFYTAIKDRIAQLSTSALTKRADMTRDEYPVPENVTVSEKVI